MGPVLLNLIGPPAVGKMTVGHEVAQRTGFRLLHNHMTIDLVLRFFDYGTPPFWRLVRSFRQQLFEEIAGSDLPGLITTFVWAFEDPTEEQEIRRYTEPFKARGLRVVFVELQATQEERLRRNRTEFRLEHKPFRRDLELSDAQLIELDQRHQLSSNGAYDNDPDWLRIDNTDLRPDVVAETIVERFGLSGRDVRF